jgi:parallel beta-helix repeat protein
MKKIVIFGLFVIIGIFLQAQTNVQGNVSGIWLETASPYQVIGEISVPAGQTLTIEPGVVVSFMGYYSFIIYGTLYAEGTADDQIQFTSGQATPAADDWEMISLESDSDASIISHSIVEYANTAILCSYSSPTISHCTIQNNLSRGINCNYSSSPSITNNTFLSNASASIFCFENCSPTITNNTFYGGTSAVVCMHSSSPHIANNIIKNVSIGVSCAYSSSPTIWNNVFYSIYDKGVYNYNLSTAAVMNNVFYSNSKAIYANNYLSALSYNSFWANTNDSYGSHVPSSFGVVNSTNGNSDPCDASFNIFIDPLLADPSAGEFGLLIDSPCIDAGNPDAGYNDPEDPENPGFALWPGMGTTICDIGTYGGGGSGGWVSNDANEVPVNSSIILHQNYPNPFNPRTTILFELNTETSTNTELEIYNLKGQKVRKYSILNNQSSIIWDGANNSGKSVPSGIYFYKLNIPDSPTRKMILLK